MQRTQVYMVITCDIGMISYIFLLADKFGMDDYSTRTEKKEKTEAY